MEEIVGYTRNNEKTPAKTEKMLREKGNYWALHVLEIPMSWMLSVAYILGTVISGYPVVHGLVTLAYYIKDPVKAVQDKSCVGIGNVAYPWNHVVAAADTLVYIFLPQWTILLLRAISGRALLHRMVGRSVVIGDIPWVAQSVEAYLSKLFACSYSAAGISVYSANPSDHLVHRMTHRVVRGGLLACGRPDDRLMALTTAEAAVCLSINQASSIQSIGSTLESLTIGHNPYSMGLAAHNLFLPGCRKQFLCESLLQRQSEQSQGAGSGPETAQKNWRTGLQHFTESRFIHFAVMLLVLVDIINNTLLFTTSGEHTGNIDSYKNRQNMHPETHTCHDMVW
jgi:hypothetical protein